MALLLGYNKIDIPLLLLSLLLLKNQPLIPCMNIRINMPSSEGSIALYTINIMVKHQSTNHFLIRS